MKLSIEQSYLSMFYLLDSIYDKSKNDCLGSLLGGFSPNLFVESISADSAAWVDWKNIVIEITKNQELSIEDALTATQKFIIFQRDEFGFDLNWLIDRLNTMQANSKDWLDSVDQAITR